MPVHDDRSHDYLARDRFLGRLCGRCVVGEARVSRRVKGQAAKAAHALFAVGKRRKLESDAQRTTMALALRMSTDDRMRALARDAVDPIHRFTAFTTLAEKLGLTYEDVAKEFTTIRKSEGLIRMAEHLPALMEETAVEAKSRDEQCRTCRGSNPACKDCGGTGTVHVLGSVERLKMVFDTFGLTGGKGGPMVNIDLRGKPARGESLADLAGSLDGIVSGSARVRDDADEEPPVQ